MNHPPCGCRVCNQIDTVPCCPPQAPCKPERCRPASHCPCECKRPCPPPCDCKPRCDCKPDCHTPCRPVPCRPCDCRRPCKTDGVLLQKIVSCDKQSFPCLCTQLEVRGLCTEEALTLVSVQQSGAQPWWTPLDETDCHGRLPICVSIPVCVQLCDACGKAHHATAVVEVETTLSLPCRREELWRHTLLIVPCVRLLGAEDSCDNRFRVKLQISLELFMLRPEVFQVRRHEPKCPDLPLYPQPVTRPCWPQCPADRDLCEWPARD